MSSSIDTLSDAELRSKLQSYGYPVGPVTQTTRKILIKKLQNLMDNRRHAASRYSLAASYSSDETDEDKNPILVKRKKPAVSSPRRQTLENPMPPPPPLDADTRHTSKTPVRGKPLNSEFKEPEFRPTPIENRMSTTKTVQKKFSKNFKVKAVHDDLETGSDSDFIEETEKIYSKSIPRLYEQQPPPSELFSKPHEPKSRSIHTIKSKDEIHDRNNMDSTTDLLANYESPFLSDFTRRLSSQSSFNLPSTLSRSNLRNSTLRHTPETKDRDSNGHYSSHRFSYPTSNSSFSSRYGTLGDRSRDAIGRNYKQTNTKEDTRNNQNMVSMILVIFLAMFFGALAVIYLGLGGKTDNLPSLSSDMYVPICDIDDANHNVPRVNCILKENVDSVVALLKRLRPILKDRAIAFTCDDSNQVPYLMDSDIIKIFSSESMTEFEVKDLETAQFLIVQNPQWDISLIDVNDYNGASSPKLNSMEKLITSRFREKVGMVILDPELPMQCHIKKKLFVIFSTLLILAIGFLAVIGSQKLFLWYVKYKKSTEQQEFRLVEEIIGLVEAHHQNTGALTPGGTQESFLAINHVRDNLIAPKDRKKMAGLWEKAVKFLDENESRIRREVQQVAGEEFHVWRWLPNNSLNLSNKPISGLNKKTKVWQGQAFETMEGSVNSLMSSPTACLKIRHMFDPDVEFEEDWETKVQDAILEKCGEDVKILHVRVDRGSREGCVYMKCSSQEDAGKAYRALHGSWFDGKLVTVKYLRLERYHVRFPEAIRCTTLVKPSNNKKLSMQAH